MSCMPRNKMGEIDQSQKSKMNFKLILYKKGHGDFKKLSPFQL